MAAPYLHRVRLASDTRPVLHDGAFLFLQPNWGGTTGDFGPRPYGMRAFLFVAWVHLSASHSRDLARCGGTVL